MESNITVEESGNSIEMNLEDKPDSQNLLLEADREEAKQSTLKENAIETKSVLTQINSLAKSCTNLVEEWTNKVKSGEISTEKGLTFLEMKNHTLLNYLISLTGLILNKCSGKTIQGSPYLDQLIETRVVLEKIRPIDQKLKYQIDKLVRVAVEGKVEKNDPLRYKANPDNLIIGNQGYASDDISSEEDEGAFAAKAAARSSGVYRPPKVAPQHYDEGTKGKAAGSSASADRGKRKPLNRTLIRELQEEYLQTPVEVHNMGDAYAKQLSRENRDKQRFEETFMTRLPVTKKDKHKARSVSTVGVLGDELTNFSERGNRSDGGGKKGKKRKAGTKGKGRGNKKRFRK